MLDDVEYQEEPLINGLFAGFYGRNMLLGFHPGTREHQQVCPALPVRLGRPWILFQTITSEYYRGAGGWRCSRKTPRGDAGLVQRCHCTRGATCAAASQTKIKRDGIATWQRV